VENEEKMAAIIRFSMALEGMIGEIREQVREDYGSDVADSVMINAATTMLAVVMASTPREVLGLMAKAIEDEIVVKIKEVRAAEAAGDATNEVISRAKAGHMTCYPDKPTKH
jgi:pyruvate/2-oxoglutarate/acetoin dehydrogenase E1 component